MAVSRWRFREFRINYFLLIVGITYGWIVLNSLYQITRIYNLSGNYWVIDTVTFVQAFSSAIFAHLPFVENIPGGPFFAVHSSPILYVLLPFYSISPGFSILYVIQSVILYSPAVVLYLIARKKMGNDLNAFLFASSYLLFGMVSQAHSKYFHCSQGSSSMHITSTLRERLYHSSSFSSLHCLRWNSLR